MASWVTRNWPWRVCKRLASKPRKSAAASFAEGLGETFMFSFLVFEIIGDDDVKALKYHIDQSDLLPSDTAYWIKCAVSYNSIQCVRLLIAEKFPIDFRNSQPILNFVDKNRCIELAFLLIEHGARTKGDDIHDVESVQSIRLQLANCRLAQNALLRCGRAKIHRDILPQVAAAVWSTRMDPKWGKVK